jgi:transketolase
VPTPATDIDLATAAELGQQLRVDSVRSSTSAGSGHPTSSMSAADLMAVLVGRHLRYDWDNPDHPGNDHLIFSKGHASPLAYSIFKAVGVVSDEELMTGYRRFGSRLEGHPTPVLPWVDVATGSLGQGLPDGVGVALAGKYLDELPYRVWVLCGDSEMAEGSMWEAFDKASHYKLANLIAIVDVNRLGQRGPTDLGWDLDAYRRRTEAFGARVFEIDGHDVAAIDQAMAEAGDLSGERPAVILARTLKGRGASEVEDREDWHGKPLPPDMAERAIVELGGERHLVVRGPAPAEGQPRRRVNGQAEVKLPAYDRGQKVATRKAYGEALAALGARPDIVAMDGEVSNSTYANLFAQAHPDGSSRCTSPSSRWSPRRWVWACAATGRSPRPSPRSSPAPTTSSGWPPISRASICLSGSHAGVEIGADGPSQMALEDLAMMRAVHGSTVLYPGDATSAAALVEAMADLDGISYMRTTRGAYPVLYEAGESFPVGGSKVLRSADDDQVTLIGAGVTLHACLAAADQLRDEGISARVIDLYSVKPADTATLSAAAAATGGRLVVAEDHHPEGGIGSAVVDALTGAGRTELSVAHLAVREMPGSGTTAELLAESGIDADAIAAAARSLLA